MTKPKERGHRPKKGAEPSQSPRALAAREKRELAKAELALETAANNDAVSGAEFDGSPIGVVDGGAPMPAETQVEKHTYKCVNCSEAVEFQIPKCAVCEEPLNWQGIA